MNSSRKFILLYSLILTFGVATSGCSDDGSSSKDDNGISNNENETGDPSNNTPCDGENCSPNETKPDASLDDVCTKTEDTCLDNKILQICVKDKKAQTKDCSQDMTNGVCEAGKCKVLENSEENACGEDGICPENYYCSFDEPYHCIQYAQLGEDCDLILCAPEFVCDEICKKNAALGEECGDTTLCSEGKCLNNICVSVSVEYGDCNDNLACPDDTVCTDGSCIPLKGGCTTNAGCKGDSYCCLEDDCGDNLHQCVPYSEDHPNNPACEFKMKPGIYEAAIQCHWDANQYPDQGIEVVASFAVSGKMHNAKGIETPLIGFASSRYEEADDYETGNYIFQTFYIIHPETCETLEAIEIPYGNNQILYTPSIADLDGDGYMEIVLFYNRSVGFNIICDSGPLIFKWDETQHKHVPHYPEKDINIHFNGSNFSIHDIDNDGIPEIIGQEGSVVKPDGTVLSTLTLGVEGEFTTCNQNGFQTWPTLGDIDNDGNVEFMIGAFVYRWAMASNGWQKIATLPGITNLIGRRTQFAYADFGTPGSTPSDFDYDKLDGKAELVVVEKSLKLFSLFASDGTLLSEPQLIAEYANCSEISPTIADFNGDGKPEIAFYGSVKLGVFDPKCTVNPSENCKENNTLWEIEHENIGGIASFDFDVDGKIELLVAGKSYVHIIDGSSGEVFYSSNLTRDKFSRNSYPLIADVDSDGSTEIVTVSEPEYKDTGYDPMHRGTKCEDESDCYSGVCVKGLCRCEDDSQCNVINSVIDTKLFGCTAPLKGDEEGGNVCRSLGNALSGVTVWRDRLDRWASSRTIWNQGAYSITNINDDGTIPKTSEWKQNFLDPKLNNYRQQRQGNINPGAAPDITGRFTSAADACMAKGNELILTAQVCNRGTKAVGSKMPAVFYRDSIDKNNILCVSYTDEMIPLKGCRMISCTIPKDNVSDLSNQKIILNVNDDGLGGKTTVECNERNNTDSITVAGCKVN